MANAAPTPSATLNAVHKHVALRCARVNSAFMACKAADNNPAACLAPGEAVTSCVVELLRDAGVKAGAELDKYSACLDYHSNTFTKCRPEQAAFEAAYPVQ